MAYAAGFAAELLEYGAKKMTENGFGCFRVDKKKLKQMGFSQDDVVKFIGEAQRLIEENKEKYHKIVKRMEDSITSKILTGEKTTTIRQEDK